MRASFELCCRRPIADLLVTSTGKPEAITAAAELQTAIIALTNRRNMLQASVDARMAILQELQRLMAVQEGLLKKNGDSLGVSRWSDSFVGVMATGLTNLTF